MKSRLLWLLLGVLLRVVSAQAEPPAVERESPEVTIQRQSGILESGSLRLQQRALRRLANLPGTAVDQLLLQKLNDLESGSLPLGLWLDLLEAIGKRPDATLRARLAERDRQLAASPDRLKAWRDCLEGGDAAEGRAIFRERPEAGCIRCHRLGPEGGEIGPDLTGLHQRAERISILESIVEPNSFIVPGFKQISLQLRTGQEVAGILNFEGSDLLRLVSPADGQKIMVQTSEIASESALPSAMPPGFGITLGRRAVRDLVEFLASQE